MPQKIFCKNCGTVLYSGEEIESPMEIIQQYNSSCPTCKKKLNFDPASIKILSSELKDLKSKKVKSSRIKR
ncbi:MAG: hypothetical protein QW265_04960 [Candidatus Bathyarchaeia archaeon]